MSDLDKRLKEVQSDIGCCHYHQESAEFREAIKQAFIDAGYVKPKDMSKEYKEIMEVATSMPARMTGQEWFEKLDGELRMTLLAHPENGDDREAAYKYRELIDAARKASRLTEAASETEA